MRKTMAILFCIILAAGLTACGGDGSDFEGTYEVTKHTLNDTACDVEGPEVTGGDAFFKLQMGDLMGFAILEYYSCTSATECEEYSDLFKSFAKLQGKWRIETQMASGWDTECNISEAQGVLEKTDLGVKLEIRTTQAAITLTGTEECDTDLVDKYSSQMVCGEYEVIEATKLE
ncbi:hypothetical protein ACFL2F_02475 [Myxococcota bacterium]